ncbi:MAG: sigma-70 family RNA polymerase sigma factor [Cyclobacteriaceae bacterium]|nr:sigma-70 family RNA polymerase sigma factor [Cyclobacteriaceae bacterium]MCK5208050.1 sigma-70 family RNA polymerase sigma factor [Cyclobacteriaceae bacterium]MCK5277784.1 sigma-70 family RNA polymerase sigma factor [Cyclobacteriaceae bacterium]MCK5370858.1 sigma-70 family RNA polymerase sigma factor [Cyclobacteriaceae bacterium]MCK5469333.1 sigma-70 family RNA polymerase sigma factor [Cyclobacteriaceae bacterium]
MESVKSSYTEEQRHHIFESEFLPHIDAMYNFAYRITYDEASAKDLLQETYYKAFRFIESFHEGTNAKAWLFRILKNSFINEFRKKNKEPSMVDYQDVETYYNSDDVNEVITSDLRVEVLQDMIGDEISNALNALAVDFRIVIILCDLEGFTYEEMSKILDIPIGTVRSRLHRARNLLRERLKTYAKSMGFK